MNDLGWINAGGEVAARIDQARHICTKVRNHKPTDKDHSHGFGTHHEYSCIICGYTYHEDSGD